MKKHIPYIAGEPGDDHLDNVAKDINKKKLNKN